MKLNPNIPPPNGFVFRNLDGTVFKATSLRVLIRKVIAYRRRLGLSPDNAAQEVEDQICKSVPDYCHQEGSPQQIVRQQKYQSVSIKHRVLQYLGSLIRLSGLKKVSEQRAADRARVCLGCPKRHAMEESCSSCARSIQALRKKCLGRESIAPTLGACSVLGADLSVAIHLEESPIQNGGLPGHCWRSKP